MLLTRHTVCSPLLTDPLLVSTSTWLLHHLPASCSSSRWPLHFCCCVRMWVHFRGWHTADTPQPCATLRGALGAVLLLTQLTVTALDDSLCR